MQLRAGWELVDRVVNETVIEVNPEMLSVWFRSFLARIIHDQCWLHEQSALWASTAASSGLRSGLALSRCGSTLSKPVSKIFNLLRVLIHESSGFVNNAG
jgi:hypothetical protein